MASLSSLPVDIFYLICDYLLDPDLLGLQLVSSAIKKKISHARLQRIHSVKSYFLVRKSIFRLVNLSQQPEQAKLVNQIKLDLARPYFLFYNLEKELERRIRERGHIPGTQGNSHYPGSREDQQTPSEAVLWEYCEKYPSHYVWAVMAGGTSGVYQLAAEGLFDVMADALRRFPNLSVIEIVCTDFNVTEKNRRTLEGESHIREWKDHNPKVSTVFDSEEAKELGLDIPLFIMKLDIIEYTTVFSRIVQTIIDSRRPISEIRLCPTLSTANKQGAELSILNYNRGVEYMTSGDTSPLDILQVLKKIDMHVSHKDWWTDGELRNPHSITCKKILGAVKELDLSMDYTYGAPPQFLVDPLTVLPYLKKLTIRTAFVNIDTLENYLKLHKATLKSFGASWDTFKKREISRQRWIRFLETMRVEMEFEEFNLDIPISTNQNSARKTGMGDITALNIHITGGWSDDENKKIHTRRIDVTEKGSRSESEHTRILRWEDLIDTVLNIKY